VEWAGESVCGSTCKVRTVRMKESRYLAPSSPRGLRYTKVLSAADVVQIASKSHDPSMRTVQLQPELHQ
jgi:hypothetical protein